MLKVQEVSVPNSSSLLQKLKAVHFSDAYQTQCNSILNVQDAYEAIFGHSPQWVKNLLKIRGVLASTFGLKHGVVGDFSRAPSENYRVTQRVGIFTVQSIKSNELIVGDNDKHLDFRISIFRSSVNGVEMVTVSTAVEIHNTLGKLYMFIVKPFHRYIARSMLQRAVDAGRL